MNAIEAGGYDVRRTSRKWGYRQLQPIGPELFEKRLSGAMLELILQISQPEWTKSPKGRVGVISSYRDCTIRASERRTEPCLLEEIVTETPF